MPGDEYRLSASRFSEHGCLANLWPGTQQSEPARLRGFGCGNAAFWSALNWSSGFLPQRYEGTAFASGATPLHNLRPAANSSPDEQRYQLDLLQRLNQQHLETDPDNQALSARIASYELAFRLQSSAPEAVDLAQETAATRRLYGMDQQRTESFGRKCLLARHW